MRPIASSARPSSHASCARSAHSRGCASPLAMRGPPVCASSRLAAPPARAQTSSPVRADAPRCARRTARVHVRCQGCAGLHERCSRLGGIESQHVAESPPTSRPRAVSASRCAVHGAGACPIQCGVARARARRALRASSNSPRHSAPHACISSAERAQRRRFVAGNRIISAAWRTQRPASCPAGRACGLAGVVWYQRSRRSTVLAAGRASRSTSGATAALPGTSSIASHDLARCSTIDARRAPAAPRAAARRSAPRLRRGRPSRSAASGGRRARSSMRRRSPRAANPRSARSQLQRAPSGSPSWTHATSPRTNASSGALLARRRPETVRSGASALAVPAVATSDGTCSNARPPPASVSPASSSSADAPHRDRSRSPRRAAAARASARGSRCCSRCCSASRNRSCRRSVRAGASSDVDEQSQPLDRVEPRRRVGRRRSTSRSARPRVPAARSRRIRNSRERRRQAGRATSVDQELEQRPLARAQRALRAPRGRRAGAAQAAPIAMRSPAGHPCVRSNSRSASASSRPASRASRRASSRANCRCSWRNSARSSVARSRASASGGSMRDVRSRASSASLMRSISRSRKRKNAGIVDAMHVVEHDHAVRHVAGVERVDDLGRHVALRVDGIGDACDQRFRRRAPRRVVAARARPACIRAGAAGRRRHRPTSTRGRFPPAAARPPAPAASSCRSPPARTAARRACRAARRRAASASRRARRKPNARGAAGSWSARTSWEHESIDKPRLRVQGRALQRLRSSPHTTLAQPRSPPFACRRRRDVFLSAIMASRRARPRMKAWDARAGSRRPW